MSNMAASGHPLVSQAACDIMKAGGNAFDAVVAAGFTSAVAEPALTSLGGGGFLLAHGPDIPGVLFDFFSDTPGKRRRKQCGELHFFPVTVNFAGVQQDFNIGMGSVAVPGTLKGLLHVHRRLGRMPLAEVIQPAREAAAKGLAVNSQQAYFFHLLEPILTMSRAGREIFAPEDRLLVEGDTYRNPDLASFLNRIAERPEDDFYSGDIARAIADDMDRGNGMLTIEDLASFQVIERKPLTFSYRGLTVMTNPPPSLGGAMIRATMEQLEKTDFRQSPFGSSGHILAVARALKNTEEMRDAIIAAAASVCTRGTTHISVRDREGNAAAMTCSNGEGSDYIIPGCGIMLNNMMGEEDLHPDGFHAAPPGAKIGSMMSPSLVSDRQGIKIIIGSGGSMRIRSAIPQVLVNLIDLGIDPDEAVRRPRIHWDGQCMQVEPGLPAESIADLEQEIPVNLWEVKDVYFGGVHTLAQDHGGGDPRRNGSFIKA